MIPRRRQCLPCPRRPRMARRSVCRPPAVLPCRGWRGGPSGRCSASCCRSRPGISSTGLLTRNSVLGTVAMVLVGFAILVAVALAIRELAGFARIARIDGLRHEAEVAVADADIKAARRVVKGLKRLYAARPELEEARERLKARGAEVFDADGLLALAEKELMTSLDQAARREIEIGCAAGGDGDGAGAAGAGRRGDGALCQPADDPPDRGALWRAVGDVGQPAPDAGGVRASRGDGRAGRERRPDPFGRGRRRAGQDLPPVRRGGGERRADGACGRGCDGGLPPPAVPRPGQPRITNLVPRALAGLFDSRDKS